jgi:hypothetical protein
MIPVLCDIAGSADIPSSVAASSMLRLNTEEVRMSSSMYEVV